MKYLLCLFAAGLLAGCTLTPQGPVSLVRGTVETDAAAKVWSDGLALVVWAPRVSARLESKAPEVWSVPPEYSTPIELEGAALLVRFYPFELVQREPGEPWPAWARAPVPAAEAARLGLVFE